MSSRTVTTRYIAAKVTVPAGTLRAAPQSNNVDLGSVIWDSVEVIVPSGHAGFTGIAFLFAGVGIVPFANPVDYIVADDDRPVFDVGIEVGNPVVVQTFNTDNKAHSFYLRFRVHDFAVPDAPAGTAAIPITAGT